MIKQQDRKFSMQQQLCFITTALLQQELIRLRLKQMSPRCLFTITCLQKASLSMPTLLRGIKNGLIFIKNG
ncbi:hypothetical protein D9M71_724760 [compost metagenome]